MAALGVSVGAKWPWTFKHKMKTVDGQARLSSSHLPTKTLLTTLESLCSLAEPEPNSGCFLWTRATNQSGYGQIGFRRSGKHIKILAHRLAWILAFGEIPQDLLVLHRCDVPSCINPQHLFLGTQSDNMQDAARKGRTCTIGTMRMTPEERSAHSRHAAMSSDVEFRCQRGKIAAEARWRKQ